MLITLAATKVYSSPLLLFHLLWFLGAAFCSPAGSANLKLNDSVGSFSKWMCSISDFKSQQFSCLSRLGHETGLKKLYTHYRLASKDGLQALCHLIKQHLLFCSSATVIQSIVTEEVDLMLLSCYLWGDSICSNGCFALFDCRMLSKGLLHSDSWWRRSCWLNLCADTLTFWAITVCGKF